MNMKSSRLFIIAAILILATTTFAMADTKCPVTGRDCDQTISANYEGQTYYFSSNGAKRLFELRPGKYTNSGAEQMTCPVMGNKIDKKIFTDYNGQRVYFCCPACIATFKANPQKYIKIVNAESNKPLVPKTKPAAAKKSGCAGCPSASTCSSATDSCSDNSSDSGCSDSSCTDSSCSR
jgi:YHS domain-containing protein